MARKTRKTRRGPAAPSDTDAGTPEAGAERADQDSTPDIADAETLPADGGDTIADAPTPTAADDTLLASEPAEDTLSAEETDAADTVVADETVAPADDADTLTGDDTTPLSGDDTLTSSPVTPSADADTVPPEVDPADIDDLRRLDGAEMGPIADEATARPVDDAATDGTMPGDTRSEDADASERSAATPPVISEGPVAEQKSSGFVPLLLGGLLAGAIGFAAGSILTPGTAEIDLSRIDAIDARLDALPPAADLSGLQAAQQEISTAQADILQRLEDLSSRIGTLETAPTVDGQAPSREAQALAALQAEVEALQSLEDRIDALPTPPPDLSENVAVLQTELMRLTEQVAALETETAAVEDTAETRAREAATNQLRIAVESGAPFAEPLDVLGGDVPPVLAENAESGLPTVQALRDAYPQAARDALAEARLSEPDAGGMSGFIRRATGARSLEPREGDDADAVLSRAEAALREGDVAGALSQVDALPDEAKAAMSDWIASARTLADARAALQDFPGTE